MEGHGSVSIGLERDLLEILKMGTYTGTCLGLGGGFMYSAAAVALDINKQVLFARDAGGSILARQLIAIAETGHLVVYSVYPTSTSEALKRFFLEYDRQFASALGILLCLESEHPEGSFDCESEVSLLLSRDYWEDGAWRGLEEEEGL